MNVGTSDKHTSVDGYYSHDGRWRRLTSARTTMKGNTPLRAVVTGRRNAYCPRWRTSPYPDMGGTRLLIDADGVADVPVEVTGQLFIPICLVRPSFLTSILLPQSGVYRPQQTAGKRRSTQSVVQATLTEGAIGYRKFTLSVVKKRWRCCA